MSSAVSSNGNGNGSLNGHSSSLSTSTATCNNGSTISDPDISQLFKRLEIEPGDAKLMERMAPGIKNSADGTCNVFTNVYPLTTEDTLIYQYHVEFSRVRIVDGQRQKPVSHHLNAEQNYGDHVKYNKREELRQLMNKFITMNSHFFGDDGLDVFCYDYDHTLFSLVKLPNLDHPLELSLEDVTPIVKFLPTPMELSILATQEWHAFSVKDFAMYNIKLLEQNNDVVRFLELATSRYAAEHPSEHCTYESSNTYLMNPTQAGFHPRSCPDLGDGKYLNVGGSKACIRVEHIDKGPSVVIDSKKSIFFQTIPMVNYVTMSLMIDGTATLVNTQLAEHLDRSVRGLSVETTHLENPIVFNICGITTTQNARQCTFDYNGGQLSVFDYYRQKYNHTLVYPHWPLVIRKKRGVISYFPFETLKFSDFQRATNRNITPKDLRVMIKESAVAPSLKATECHNMMKSYRINDEKFCQNAGVSVIEEPIKLQGRILAPPNVSYANGNLLPDASGRWRLPRQAKYVKTGIMKFWGAILIKYGNDEFTLDKFKEFVKSFINECRNRGLTVEDPVGVWDCEANEHDIETYFKDGGDNGCEFILVGHPDNEITLHPMIKAYERKYSVISQCVRTSTMDKVLKKSPLSLENIVAKTNIKIGGHNYNITLGDKYDIDPKVLFIGMGINHPSGGFGNMSEGPSKAKNFSILGFSANDGKHPKAFIGNFFVQPAGRSDTTNILDEIMIEILERFLRYRGYKPEHVVLYRTGCSEGEFGRVLRMEVPILHKILKDYAPDATLTVVIPSKMHSVRFFRQGIDKRASAMEQNIRPGSCFDTTIVHPHLSEFYLNSHLALHGTAKTPKYTVLYTNYPDKSLETIQRWTNVLAYNYQIVTSPTSLPAPVYIAIQYANRGRQLYTASLSSDHGPDYFYDTVDEARNDVHNVFYTDSLKYNFTTKGYLREKRINA